MAQISRNKILEAALTLLDSEGEAFSMRRLGKALNVDAKAIYYYYPNKDSLLNATLKHALQELQRSDVTSPTWQGELTALAHAYANLAAAHPNIVPLMLRLDGTMPAAFDLMEPVVAILARTSLPERYILHVVELFVSFLPSYMIEDGTEHLDDDGLLEHLRTLPTEQYPAIHQLLSRLLPGDLQTDHDVQIDILIWGIEKLIENGIENRT